MLIYNQKAKSRVLYIKSFDQIDLMDEEAINVVKNNHATGQFTFMIPPEIEDNKFRMAYKILFLKKLYEKVFPDWSMARIYKCLNQKWQIFIDQRQMERYVQKYGESDFRG